MAFDWIEKVDELSPAALTVRAQLLDPTDDGHLVWDVFFPRRDVDSVDLRDVVTLDDRPAADRREWNARGRMIPLKTPDTRELEMVPIEAYDKIDEREMQKLRERTLNNQGVIQEIIGTSLPRRSDRLAMACYRRLELDVMQVWSQGTLTQRNPQDASKTYTASFGISTSRITTAGTAWNDAGLNAYDEFLAWYEDAVQASGNGVGAVMRLATYKEILKDAPDLGNGVKMTRAQIEDRIQQDLGSPFRFILLENSIDVFDDGGVATTRTKIWPTGRVAFVPDGTAVGYAGFAPVSRAMELSAQVPEAGINVRGVTVYHDASNGGRELALEAQINALPVPDEGKVFVINAGV